MAWGFRNKPYVSARQRQQRGAQKIARLKKQGRDVKPVEIEGRQISTTFWGDAWCKNLEAFSDFASRLPRGRTYARNGSVIDLQIAAGQVRALVVGSDDYDVVIDIQPLPKPRWEAVKAACSGQIESVVELLQGSISDHVMGVVTRTGEGLFPTPGEIELSCSCPDWATMCKHVAAALYGVGARLDHDPAMLFTLRDVPPSELIASAVNHLPSGNQPTGRKRLSPDDLATVFGIDLALDDDVPKAAPKRRAAKRKRKPR